MITQHLSGDGGRGEAAGGADVLRALEAVLTDRLDEVADRAVRRILSSVPGFRKRSVGELEDLWRSVSANLSIALTLLVERRAAAPDELERWHALGRRRALQGVALDDVMRALRVTNTVLWEAVTDAALRTGSECPQEVLAQAALVWETFDRISSEVARGHQEVASSQDVRARQQGLALIDAIRRHPEDDGGAAALARQLGLEPHGVFVAAVHRGRSRELPADLRAVAVEQPDRTILLVQVPRADAAAEEFAVERLGDAAARPLGLGMARPGLAGAQQSLADADLAYRAAELLGEDLMVFRDSWLVCLALRHRAQQEVLVAPAVRALRDDPDLRSTVEAYLEHDGSLTAAGRALHLHANTVAYRLRVLAERTGLDARSASGSALAQVALALARAEAAGAGLALTDDDGEAAAAL
jgi:hypothetical protein